MYIKIKIHSSEDIIKLYTTINNFLKIKEPRLMNPKSIICAENDAVLRFSITVLNCL